MAKEVRYATTSDGIQIGFASSGSGPVLVCMPDLGFGSMLMGERDLPDLDAWAEAVSRRFTYVRYDSRGYGFSQHDVLDTSLPTWTLDIDAVVRALGLRTFALVGWLGSTRVALDYAASHPQQVSHLLAFPPDYPVMSSTEGANLEGLARHDWDTFTETLAHVMMGWERSQRARELSAHWRATVSKETYLRFLDQFKWPAIDEAAALRGALTAPLLVIARRHKYLTHRIPVLSAALDARVALLPGEDALPYEGDIERIIETAHGFVLDQPAAERGVVSLEPEPDTLAGRHLTAREREVLDLMATGKSNAEIADELVISVRTVERHLMRIYGKFGVSGKSARVIAAAHAILQVT
jgi:DNA-binding CsgD family transcriptional regulator/pimeloyl-ACP methyl ester carboxylesterase